MQTTSTEVLKSFVFNEPIVVDAARLQPLGPAAIFMVWSGYLIINPCINGILLFYQHALVKQFIFRI